MSNREEPYDPYIPSGGNVPGGQGQPGGEQSTARIQKELDSAVQGMQQNIKRLEERDNNLRNLEDQTNHLNASAAGFRRGANQVRKKMWWSNQKWRCAIIVGIIIIIAIIAIGVGVGVKHH